MPEIITYNTPPKIAKERTKQPFYRSFFDWFSSRDKFTKLYLITFALIILATPFITNNYLETRQRAVTIPNDPLYPQQWALTKIRAAEAWDITTGSRAVKVAVVGSGVDSGHPDLAANMIGGYNAINPAADTQDELFDGTTAAGVVGAIGNNNIGMAGIAWQVSIMPVKVCVVFDCDGAVVARGIRWAADNGANIIHVNAVSSQDTAGDLRNAVAYAQTRGIIVVGYAFRLPGGSLWYPGALVDVVTVGLTTRSDSSLSPSGAELDIVAPGVGIVSTWPGGTTRSTDGPHLAAAHVTGVLALLLSKGVTPAAAVDAIFRGAFDLGVVGRDDTYGFGRLDACGALNTAGVTCPAVVVSPIPTLTPIPTPPTTPTPTVILTPTPTRTPTPTSTPLPTPTSTPTSTPVTTPTPVTGVTISGTVTSSAGGVISGAQIKVSSLMPWGTPVTTVSSNSEGFYTASNLQPNRVYRLTISAAGHQTKTDYVTVYSSPVIKNITLQKI